MCAYGAVSALAGNLGSDSLRGSARDARHAERRGQ